MPEGIEGMVPYKGPLADQLTQLVGGLRAGMGLAGCATIAELHERARFIRVTAAGLRESPRPRRGHHQGSAELPDGSVGCFQLSAGQLPLLHFAP